MAPWMVLTTPLAFVTTSILTIILFYLCFYHRKRHLVLWSLAFSTHALRYLLETVRPATLTVRVTEQIAYLLISALLSWATLEFVGRRLSTWWVWGLTLGLTWIAAGVVGHLPPFWLSLPIALLSGATHVWAGTAILRSPKDGGFGKHLVGWALILWGLHTLDYPFSQAHGWTPWAHLLSASFGILAAMGMLLFSFERAREELVEAREHFRRLVDNARDVVYRYRLKPDPGFDYLSPSIHALTGYSPQEFYADPGLIERVIADGYRERLSGDLSAARVQQTRVLRAVRKDGSLCWIEDVPVTIYDAAGQLVAVEGIIRDVTDRCEAEIALRYLSFHDKLTGLYNRAFFEEEARRVDVGRQLPFSVILGDVNGLKLVNDAFGHAQGDELLRRVAKALTDSCRKEDLVARWGGDEFAVLVPDAGVPEVEAVCRRIEAAFAEGSLGPVPLSISLGTATKHEGDETLAELLRSAEEQMYRHKLLESRSTQSAIIASLSKTLWESSHETEEHAARMRSMALELGASLGLTSSELDDLTLLCTLHDIGKVSIPGSILEKRGQLTGEEWAIVMRHPETGYRIVQTFPSLAGIADAILAHHERWDGTGYPRGLAGKAIPLAARALAIIDAFDVMTHERPYKQAHSVEHALKELRRCAGTQFDPTLVEAFVKTVRAKGSLSEMEAEGGRAG